MKTRRSCSTSDQKKEKSRLCQALKSSSSTDLKAKSSKIPEKDLKDITSIAIIGDSSRQRSNTSVQDSTQDTSKRNCDVKLKLELPNATKRSKSCSSVLSRGTENDGRSTHVTGFTKIASETNSICIASTSSQNFSKTLKVCCKRVDDGLNHSTRRRKQKLVSREDVVEYSIDESVGNHITEKTLLNKEVEETSQIQGSSGVSIGCITPVACSTTDVYGESPVKTPCAKSEADESELNGSFRLDILNMGYSHSPKQALAQPDCTPKQAKDTKTKLKLYLNVSPTVGNFRITAPLYQCAAYQPGRGIFNVDTIKNCIGGQKRKPVKRKLCSEIKSSTNKGSTDTFCRQLKSLLKTGAPSTNHTTPSTSGVNTLTNTSRDPIRAKLSTQDRPQIWLSPCLQIDTMGCNGSGGAKKDYNRVVVICAYGSSFTPNRAVSRYPDAVNARVTYDKDGKVAVIEPLSTLSAGIYRVIYTKVAIPHPCLTRTVAMETLLSRCSSIEDMKPHSQYVLLTDMYMVPKRQWREKLSATVVRLHLEDYLHTANFHNYALPLLRWNGEVDSWSWTRQATVKFHAKRKRKSSANNEKTLVTTKKKVKLSPQTAV